MRKNKGNGYMKTIRIIAAACMGALLASSSTFAGPTAQILVPSTDIKGLKEVAVGFTYIGRFSQKADAGASSNDISITTGLLPYENLKTEVGVDYVTSDLQNDNAADNHPFSFNIKAGTPEDAFEIKGLPSFAVGVYNIGTYENTTTGVSTRQNIVYGLVARTLPVIGRLSAGGYTGSERALGKGATNGVLASWDRTITEVSEKLWLGVDYMSGGNANGELSLGASWSFSKQVTLLVGAVFYNPFYQTSGTGTLPGGKPAYTTQLTLNLP
jgi:hypothetical protein